MEYLTQFGHQGLKMKERIQPVVVGCVKQIPILNNMTSNMTSLEAPVSLELKRRLWAVRILQIAVSFRSL
jgi:hypothetical protein